MEEFLYLVNVSWAPVRALLSVLTSKRTIHFIIAPYSLKFHEDISLAVNTSLMYFLSGSADGTPALLTCHNQVLTHSLQTQYNPSPECFLFFSIHCDFLFCCQDSLHFHVPTYVWKNFVKSECLTLTDAETANSPTFFKWGGFKGRSRVLVLVNVRSQLLLFILSLKFTNPSQLIHSYLHDLQCLNLHLHLTFADISLK